MIELRDPGDEDDGPPPWIMTWGGRFLCFFNRDLVEEPLPTLPDHDPGDADVDWRPLSDVSRKRVERRLGFPL